MKFNAGKWSQLLRRGADIAGGLAEVVEDPKLQAELIDRLRKGTLEPGLETMQAEGLITAQQAQLIRQRLGWS